RRQKGARGPAADPTPSLRPEAGRPGGGEERGLAQRLWRATGPGGGPTRRRRGEAGPGPFPSQYPGGQGRLVRGPTSSREGDRGGRYAGERPRREPDGLGPPGRQPEPQHARRRRRRDG